MANPFSFNWLTSVVRQINRSKSYGNTAKSFTARLLIESGPEKYILTIFEGKVLRVKRYEDWTNSWDFALRGSSGEWEKFMDSARLYNDLFACLRRGFLRLEGNVELAMTNVGALVGLLEIMRAHKA